MLQRIQIENFRCLKSVVADLKPLTVLIGPNDSGKSAFVAAIEHLINGTIEFNEADFWRLDQNSRIRLSGTTSVGQLETTSTKSPRRRIILSEDEVSPRDELKPVQRFQLPSTGVSMECPGYSEKEEATLSIDGTGSGIPALLDHLLRKDRSRFFRIVESLKQNIPGLEDVEINTPDPQTRRLDLVIENGLRLRADEASAGVRLLLFFVSLAHHPKPPQTILLEEPETGIHPKRLGEVMSLLRAITMGKFAKNAAQVILTTHSPYLLDFVRLPEDQVLVFRRNEDGSRTAQPADANRLKSFLDEFMLGEVWFNEEEAGLVAKP